MVESALTKTSDSVTLDLLTYGDLQSLRNQKASTQPAAASCDSLNSKRYLILTYSVEFDRIHYPLPLPYLGKPDPVALLRVRLFSGFVTREAPATCATSLVILLCLQMDFQLWINILVPLLPPQTIRELRTENEDLRKRLEGDNTVGDQSLRLEYEKQLEDAVTQNAELERANEGNC